MQKVVKLYIKDEYGVEYSSDCFNIMYHQESDLFWFLFNIYRTIWDVTVIDTIYLNEPIFDQNGELDYEIPIACYDEFEKPAGLSGYKYFTQDGLISGDFIDVINLYKTHPEKFKKVSGFTISDCYYSSKFVQLKKNGNFLTLTTPNLGVECPIDMFQKIRVGFGG